MEEEGQQGEGAWLEPVQELAGWTAWEKLVAWSKSTELPWSKKIHMALSPESALLGIIQSPMLLSTSARALSRDCGC